MSKKTKRSLTKAIYFTVVSFTAFGMVFMPMPNVNKTQATSVSIVDAGNISVQLSNSGEGATANYVVSVTGSEAIPDNGIMHISAMSQGQGDPGSGGQVDFSNASFSSSKISGTPGNKQPGYMQLNITSGTNNSSWSFTLSNVVNPDVEGPYGFEIRIYADGDQGGQNDRGQSTIFAIGTPSAQGTVTLPGGDPLSGGWVQVATEDWSQSWGGNITGGSYMIFDIPAGTYNIQVFGNPEDTVGYIAPMGKTITIANNQTTTKNLRFTQATKYLTGTVKRKNGAAVTDALIEANQMGGGSHVEAQVNSSGVYSLSVGPGTWDVQLRSARNDQGQQISVD